MKNKKFTQSDLNQDSNKQINKSFVENDKLIKEINNKLTTSKLNYLKEMKEFIPSASYKFKTNFNNEVNRLFSLEENILNHLINRCQNLNFIKTYNDINKNNIAKVNDLFLQLEIINKNQYQLNQKLINKTQDINEIVSKFQLMYKQYLFNTILNDYFVWFNNFIKPKLDQLKAKMQLIEKLSKQLESIKDIFGNFWDLSPSNLTKIDISFLEQMQQLINQNQFLEKIADVLGKFAQAYNEYETQLVEQEGFKYQRKILSSPSANPISIKFGDNLNNILKYQLALRKLKQGDKLFKLKLIEKQLIEFDQAMDIYEFKKQKYLIEQKINKNNKGPFIMCIDTSGSMHGLAENIAKAMCMLIIKIANKQKRKAYLINFSTKIDEFDATNIANNFNKLYDFLSHSFNGGTDIEIALKRCVELLNDKDYQNADVIVISDLIVNHLNNDVSNQINELKTKKVRFNALCIGNNSIDENTKYFDNIWVYDGSNSSINNILKSLDKYQ